MLLGLGHVHPGFRRWKSDHLHPDERDILPPETSRDLQRIPAHDLHSSGNFSVYNPVPKIQFSGDMGAALLPDHHADLFVKDFERHIRYREDCHRRWMPSNEAKLAWVRRVRELDIRMMRPQHGAIFRGDDVGHFIAWFEGLEVGTAVHVDRGAATSDPAAKLRAS